MMRPVHRSARAAGDGDRQPCGFAAVLSRRRYRLPVGSRHDQRCGDGWRATAVSGRQFHSGEGFPLADLQRIVSRWRGRRSRRGRSHRHRRYQSGGTRQGRRGVYHHHRRWRDSGRSGHFRQPGATGRRLLLSGALGDHGMAVLAQRENLSFDAPIESDTAALHTLVAAMVAVVPELHCLRDPTRGGWAAP
jgi:hypothetical protein